MNAREHVDVNHGGRKISNSVCTASSPLAIAASASAAATHALHLPALLRRHRRGARDGDDDRGGRPVADRHR
jgi:hypothetical protein